MQHFSFNHQKVYIFVPASLPQIQRCTMYNNEHFLLTNRLTGIKKVLFISICTLFPLFLFGNTDMEHLQDFEWRRDR
jgi:hypothetical protein